MLLSLSFIAVILKFNILQMKENFEYFASKRIQNHICKQCAHETLMNVCSQLWFLSNFQRSLPPLYFHHHFHINQFIFSWVISIFIKKNQTMVCYNFPLSFFVRCYVLEHMIFVYPWWFHISKLRHYNKKSGVITFYNIFYFNFNRTKNVFITSSNVNYTIYTFVTFVTLLFFPSQ